jgi:hypothetical protein
MYTIEHLGLIHAAVVGYDLDPQTRDRVRDMVTVQEAALAEERGIRFGPTFAATYDSARRLGLVGAV